MKLIFKSLRPIPLIFICVYLTMYMVNVSGSMYYIVSMIGYFIICIRIVTFDKKLKKFIPIHIILGIITSYLIIKCLDYVLMSSLMLVVICLDKKIFPLFIVSNLLLYQFVLYNFGFYKILVLVEIAILLIFLQSFINHNKFINYIITFLAVLVSCSLLYFVDGIKKMNLIPDVSTSRFYVYNGVEIIVYCTIGYLILVTILSLNYYLKRSIK